MGKQKRYIFFFAAIAVLALLLFAWIKDYPISREITQTQQRPPVAGPPYEVKMLKRLNQGYTTESIRELFEQAQPKPDNSSLRVGQPWKGCKRHFLLRGGLFLYDTAGPFGTEDWIFYQFFERPGFYINRYRNAFGFLAPPTPYYYFREGRELFGAFNYGPEDAWLGIEDRPDDLQIEYVRVTSSGDLITEKTFSPDISHLVGADGIIRFLAHELHIGPRMEDFPEKWQLLGVPSIAVSSRSAYQYTFCARPHQD